jgi:AcrR family transcriptional regulator
MVQAISATLSVVVSNSRLASSMRRAITYWCGARPIVALKQRAKWNGLTCASAARSSRVICLQRFASIDDLIAAYLEEQDHLHVKLFEDAIAAHEGSPKAQLLALVDAIVEGVTEPGYRGCAFLNALAEFSEADHPAHRQAVEHKRALRLRLYRLSQQAGACDSEGLADQLLLLINGALASVPVFGSAAPVAQLKTIATHLIDLQLDSAQGKP